MCFSLGVSRLAHLSCVYWLTKTSMAATKKLSSLFPLLSLICFISFFLSFFFSLFPEKPPFPLPRLIPNSSALNPSMPIPPPDQTHLQPAIPHAITQMGHEFTTQMRDLIDTIVAARRYSKDGIAF
ncbi:hypothetical protein J1N35_001942 [Gossypium stocksii]|uniref:Uncharacterized protein n=1 Tax=Gossypium stocksii TaxID=47602 RepID=A0A9D4AMX6_9ROSI|nr:hypothetical protein J1N35_001942 [Gossypium stocksii]